MDKEILRTLTAAVILAGLLSSPEAGPHSAEIRNAVAATDKLLEALKRDEERAQQ
jgi:hypothetical protein